MTPLSVMLAILSPAFAIILVIAAMVVVDCLPASGPRHTGRHRAVIDGEVISSDTLPIPIGGAR